MGNSSEDDYYAISFISYERPEQRAAFFAFAETLVRTTALLFGARPHWGKYCPLDAAQAEQLYPQLSLFHEQCAAVDPQGVFRNAWCQRVLWGQSAVSAVNN